MSDFRLVEYEPSRQAELFDLMRSVWGEYMDAEEFEWWFERNPVGPRLITLAEDDEGVLGMLAMSFARMRCNGSEVLAAAAVQGATHPRARGRGVFSEIELFNEARSAEHGARVAVGFTNPEAGPILVGRVGWRDVRRLRLWARPLRGLLRGSGPVLREGTGDVARFGAEHERLYRSVSASWPDHYVRAAEYLNWRYLDSPKGYRAFEHRVAGESRGFAVLGQARHHGREIAVVADLVADGVRSARALLRGLIAETGPGAQALVGLPPPGLGGAFASCGFVPTPVTIRLIGKPLAESAAVGDWYFSLGDTDIF